MITDESDSDDYYNYNDVDEDFVLEDESDKDPEFFEYHIITQDDAERMLDSLIDETARKIKVNLCSCSIENKTDMDI